MYEYSVSHVRTHNLEMLVVTFDKWCQVVESIFDRSAVTPIQFIIVLCAIKRARERKNVNICVNGLNGSSV